MLLSRANVIGHAHVVAVAANHDDHEHILFVTPEQWRAVREGAAVEVPPGTLMVALADGMDDDGPR